MAKEKLLLSSDWLFMRNWTNDMISPSFDDSAWRSVKVPHDWSIEGTFSQDAPAYCRGAWLPTGTACYRKHIMLSAEQLEEEVLLLLEGVWRNSEIYVNGHKAGGREWGYISFEVVLPHEHLHEGDNVIAVKVDNSLPLGCRWYSGSGIYRPVFLEFRNPCFHFPRNSLTAACSCRENGQACTTFREGRGAYAALLTFSIRNASEKLLKGSVRHVLRDPAGKIIFEEEKTHIVGTGLTITLTDSVPVPEAKLWSPDSPHLYTWECTLSLDGGIADREQVRFGFRSIEFDADNGFLLNGKEVKIKGVCLHNDGGALGAACGKNTFLRQLGILKEMGCNAVRTAHHPFSPAFLDACDELGVLVLAETFDEWDEPIRVAPMADGEYQAMYSSYYSAIFGRCALSDLADAVRRDRNHPCIFMWSIGNEVPQMYKYSGNRIAGTLTETVHNIDPTRPVTCALLSWKVKHDNVDLLDVGGYNYPSGELMDQYHKRHPDQPMIVTECYSAQTRRPLGVYCAEGKLETLAAKYPDQLHFIRGHEDMMPGRSAWNNAAARKFIMGAFIWTGWDYLGEITPYDFPAHGSFFGVIDSCGRPKDGYFYYRSVWRGEPLVHIAPAWDFEKGDKVKVHVISNCEKTELFLNGTSCGVKGKDEDLCWCLDYVPGVLLARGYNGGKEAASERVVTSGEPAEISLLQSGGMPQKEDFLYLLCFVKDSNGDPVRNKSVEVTFHVLSGGTIEALDNGNQLSLEPFRNADRRMTCDGGALCIIRVNGFESVRVEAEGCWNGTRMKAEYFAEKPTEEAPAGK